VAIELPLPMGGFAEGPEGAVIAYDLSSLGPGGAQFLFRQQKNLMPSESPAVQSSRILKPGPGELGFRSVQQENLLPQAGQRREPKKANRKK
jgi:hypothetical protein